MKDKSLSLIIVSLFFLTLVITASYAYFASRVDTEGGSIEASILTTDDKPAFKANVGNTLSLNINIEEMSVASTTPLQNNTSTIDVTLSGGSPEGNVSCTYDIYFVRDSDKYTKTTSLPATDDDMNSYPFELSLKGTSAVDGKASVFSEAQNLQETNLDDLVYEEGNRAKVVSGAKIISASKKDPTKVIWTFTMNFYVLPTRQNALIDKNYKGHFVVSNVIC